MDGVKEDRKLVGERRCRGQGEMEVCCGEFVQVIVCTVKAPSAIFVISLLSEAIVPKQLVGRMPELGQRLGSAAVASRQRRSF